MPTYLEKSVVLATSPHRDFWSRDIIRTTRSMPEMIAKSVLDTPQYGSIAFTIHHTFYSFTMGGHKQSNLREAR